MGQSQSISAEIEIQASPATVRSVFLDFSRYNQWSQWAVEPTDSGKSPSELKAGDRVKADLKSMKFQPVVVENTADKFQWEGKLPLIFVGNHEFHFAPSTKHPGGTTFIQLEIFTGLLAFIMGPGWSMRESSLANWHRFNADLKKEVEKSSHASS
ncbi:hypothetical protein B0T10DRAFT_490109 [Thelonectria olida]|uniref:SRPBCC domain-containing protein n=1 Tax=Thelonectria olida TaxID=1576542 RepID=A0A9P8W489_9HYPO|nr:hypothetical protein B0T10DRAFT_490109 [Thelonectria olida]